MAKDSAFRLSPLVALSLAACSGPFWATLLVQDARADFYLHYWETHHEPAKAASLGGAINLYSSTQNYDSQGGQIIPDKFEKYSRTQLDVSGQYGFNDRFTAYARLGWSRAEVAHATRAGSAFGFPDQTIGLNARFLSIRYKDRSEGPTLDFQAQWDFPIYDNASSEANLTPYMGDGSMDFTGGLFLAVPVYQTKAGKLSLRAGAGYSYRTAEFSAAVPWMAGLDYVARESGFYGGAGAFGYQSLKTDPRGKVATATTTTTVTDTSGSIGTGGSFITNAVNPSLVNARGWVGYRFDRIEAEATLAKSVWGMTAPAGLLVSIGLRGHFGKDQTGKRDVELTPKDYGKANQGFVDYGLEAHVTRVSDKLSQIKIDAGSDSGVVAGQSFDLFPIKGNGTLGDPVARAEVLESKTGEATLTIIEYYREILIDEGFVAKRALE